MKAEIAQKRRELEVKIAQNKKDLQEAQEHKRERDALGKMSNPWAK